MAILRWEFYVFFKVSRFIPYDIQMEIEYDMQLLKRDKVDIIVRNDFLE
jgi:hypothetical protein